MDEVSAVKRSPSVSEPAETPVVVSRWWQFGFLTTAGCRSLRRHAKEHGKLRSHLAPKRPTDLTQRRWKAEPCLRP